MFEYHRATCWRERKKKTSSLSTEADEIYVTYTWPEGGITTTTTTTTTNQSIV